MSHQTAAATKSADEWYALGTSHLRDLEFAEAVSCFEYAAEQQHAEAQYELGLAYLYGMGCERHVETAVFWFEQAAENGNVNAMFSLCECCDNGMDAISEERARKWAKAAAARGISAPLINRFLCTDEPEEPQEYSPRSDRPTHNL